MASNASSKLLYIVIIVVLGIAAYAFLTRPDDRNAVQKVGDAIQKEDTRELKDRTPGDRISDSVKDATTPDNTSK